MKKIILLVFILLLLIAGYFVAAHFSNGKLPSFGLEFNSQKSIVKHQALRFWEDIKFKDINSASKILSGENNKNKEIIAFLERIFQQPPERLDIVTCEILKVEIDSTQKRARVKLKVIANNLVTGSELQPEVMMFFYKNSKLETWLLELKSSF